MDKVLEEYLTGISKLLNGQLRGAINFLISFEGEPIFSTTKIDSPNKTILSTLGMILGSLLYFSNQSISKYFLIVL